MKKSSTINLDNSIQKGESKLLDFKKKAESAQIGSLELRILESNQSEIESQLVYLKKQKELRLSPLSILPTIKPFLLEKELLILNKQLMNFCQLGGFSKVQELVNSGADVNYDTGLNTPLTTACQFGNGFIAYFLLNKKANPDLCPKHMNMTPLMLACGYGYKSMVHILLEAKATPNKAGVNHETPYTAICNNFGKGSNNKSNIIELLIEYKASVDTNNQIYNDANLSGEKIPDDEYTGYF